MKYYESQGTEGGHGNLGRESEMIMYLVCRHRTKRDRQLDALHVAECTSFILRWQSL